MFRKICNLFCGLYWRLISTISKRYFEKDKKDVYQYGDELFCNGKDAFDKTVKKYSCQIDRFWSEQNNYSTKTYFPKMYSETEKLIFSHFFPKYEYKPMIIDIGCGSGEWTAKMAPSCSEIHGLDYSKKMIETSKNEWKEVPNVSFFSEDARKMKLNTVYDGAVILGMMMYIDDDDTFKEMIQNISEHIKNGGYLCTRDTLNMENKEIVFLYNKRTGYNAVYRSEELYVQLIQSAGFEKVEEYIVNEVHTRRLHFVAKGYIWRKC